MTQTGAPQSNKPQAEMSEADREQVDVWAAELERRNEGSGHGNPNRRHEHHEE